MKINILVILALGIMQLGNSCKKDDETIFHEKQKAASQYNTAVIVDWYVLIKTLATETPEYTSGHSVQSGALAEIMTDIFGEDYSFTDRTHEVRSDVTGPPRQFNSFYDLAREAAISRLYGGIHFQEATDLGLEQGYRIGMNVNALDLNK